MGVSTSTAAQYADRDLFCTQRRMERERDRLNREIDAHTHKMKLLVGLNQLDRAKDMAMMIAQSRTSLARINRISLHLDKLRKHLRSAIALKLEQQHIREVIDCVNSIAVLNQPGGAMDIVNQLDRQMVAVVDRLDIIDSGMEDGVVADEEADAILAPYIDADRLARADAISRSLLPPVTEIRIEVEQLDPVQPTGTEEKKN